MTNQLSHTLLLLVSEGPVIQLSELAVTRELFYRFSFPLALILLVSFSREMDTDS